MKNKVFFIALFLILLVVALVCFLIPRGKQSVTTSYSKGKEEVTHRKGAEVVKTKEFREHSSIVKKPKKPRVSVLPDSAAVVSQDSGSMFPFTYEKRDSAGNLIYLEQLNVITWPAVDSIRIDRDFVINQLEKTRVDTLEKVRTDTIRQVLEVEKPAPPKKFYDTFWAGAAAVALGVALIVSIF